MSVEYRYAKTRKDLKKGDWRITEATINGEAVRFPGTLGDNPDGLPELKAFITLMESEGFKLVGKLPDDHTPPPPDVSLYVIGNGAGAEVRHGINPLAFDFGTFIPHIVEMLGDHACTAYVSTWTMNENHVKAMIAMLEDGRLSQLTVFTDPYFSRRTPPIYAQLVTGLQHYPDRGRYLAFKNHVKVIAIASPEGRTCVITGSANLSAQPRTEQYVLTTAPDVYAFFRDSFFEAMLSAKS